MEGNLNNKDRKSHRILSAGPTSDLEGHVWTVCLVFSVGV